ncbi:predicted protein [Arabidopsis lyrata subsp. lyrata]|uniref:Predicted protein n=1 Tax=Arabidopsis lyrata subsp. lyrata TaxID=81972 RepID=D7LDG6_ARALL|nr:predicted protein [Arabidopsis lyrata subsp. lyrata]
MELGKSIENQNNVVVRLAKKVIDTMANGSNVVFSPMSINVLLSLIAAGSNTVTKEEILSFLMSPSTDHLNAVLAKMTDDGTEREVICAYLRLTVYGLTSLFLCNLPLKSFWRNRTRLLIIVK